MSRPLHLDLRGRRVLVVGGSPAAARQARECAADGADVLVLAERACEAVEDLARQHEGVRWLARDWRPADLDDAWLVHALTADAVLDARLAQAAAARRVWCVVHADPATGSATGRPRTGRPSHHGPGRVTLVGGGPGDPGLLTLRGRRRLAEADVVVVDRLAPTSLLDDLDPDVQVIDVGKSPDHHPVPQDEINALLVEHARAGRRVVRLKGGDSYLLGRGGEEVAACRAAGVAVSVVPGVTSAFGVPAAAGIPVTHRGLARSVTVVTGHDAFTDERLDALARLGGTLVVLMGVAQLASITAGLQAHGLAADTPVAVVERGCTPDQRVTLARLDAVAAVAAARDVRAPAVVVIGEVAALALADEAGDVGTLTDGPAP